MNSISIQNDHFSAQIDLHGAQLSSLIHKAKAAEFIWQRDPAFWGESAPICFPIVGGLKEGTYQYDGQSYSMNKHGVVRYADFSIKSQTNSSCTLVVKANEQTLASYPFLFVLEISFLLTDQGIRVAYLIKNEDNQDMPTSLGYHPAFNIDVENYVHDDYEIIFSKPETLDLFWLKDGLLELKENLYLSNENTIKLNAHLFDDDALIFKDIKSDQLTLQRKNSDWKIVMLTGGAPHLGIWAKPAAPYVCLEPWYTYQDSADVSGNIFEKPGMFVLAPGDIFTSFYEVRV